MKNFGSHRRQANFNQPSFAFNYLKHLIDIYHRRLFNPKRVQRVLFCKFYEKEKNIKIQKEKICEVKSCHFVFLAFYKTSKLVVGI